jgi:hypothetical protein
MAPKRNAFNPFPIAQLIINCFEYIRGDKEIAEGSMHRVGALKHHGGWYVAEAYSVRTEQQNRLIRYP